MSKPRAPKCDSDLTERFQAWWESRVKDYGVYTRKFAPVVAGRALCHRTLLHCLFPVPWVTATPHPASSLRELADLPAWRGGEIAYPPGADLPTAWGGEIGADSPPGALASRAGRTSPRGGEARLPTHPAPTSPLCGEAKLAPTPHPARSLRELADLPTSWGGDLARGSGEDLLVSGDFGGVVQRGEVVDAATLERAPDQVVGEMRVLGQQRTVEVRAEDGSLQAAFGVILAVVAA